MAASHEETLAEIARLKEAQLDATELSSGRWIRICDKIYSDALGFSAAAESRFSDPDKTFGVVYFGRALAASVAEVIIRDRKVGNPGLLVLSYDEAVGRWRAFYLGIRRPLQVLDLTNTGLIKFGIRTDVARGQAQSLSRQLSKAIHDNQHISFDGILYDSRIVTSACLVEYDRALPKLALAEKHDLDELMHELGPIYRGMNVTVRRPAR